ncbi:MAG: SDR family oxidoreductase [Lachnospiraceae bacterium]|jgi:short-subunit dehydrogenase|nr:SDR family oxidoreductase [Lachnospiraceae bacterium]MEE3461513.1 SDR family oxidoreductase [Lachnospiraceae bacterium]
MEDQNVKQDPAVDGSDTEKENLRPVALITGASSGIGREIAKVLAGIGYDLVLTGRSEDELKKTVDQCRRKARLMKLDIKAAYITADLTCEETVKKLYKKTKDMNISFLVNNAGFGDCGDFWKTDLDKDIAMIKTNVTALHILTKCFLKDFVGHDRGYILNVASSAGFLAGPGMATYYATKNYVLRLTQAIHQELKENKSHVHISALCPGPVETKFNDRANVRFGYRGLNAADVAEEAVDGTLEGKLVIVPGALMKATRIAERFVPDPLLLKATYGFQHRKIDG